MRGGTGRPRAPEPAGGAAVPAPVEPAVDRSVDDPGGAEPDGFRARAAGPPGDGLDGEPARGGASADGVPPGADEASRHPAREGDGATAARPPLPPDFAPRRRFEKLIDDGGEKRRRSRESRAAVLAAENDVLRATIRELRASAHTLAADAELGHRYALAREYQALGDAYSHAAATVARLREENRHLESLLSRREREVQALGDECGELRRARTELNDRVDKLVGELARIRLDPATTFVSDARPQHHVLVQEFRHLRDQQFHAAATAVFEQYLREGLAQPAERRTCLAEIKAHFAGVLLLDAGPALERAAAHPDPISVAAGELTEALQRAPSRCGLAPPVLDTVRALTRRCLAFVAQIRTADPSAELWLDDGASFNPRRHDPTPDCEPEGRVVLTVHPGYSVQGRVFEKAVVRTGRAA